MNLTDRIYLAVHAALTLLVVARHGQIEHWPRYVIWNVVAIAAILVLAGAPSYRTRSGGRVGDTVRAGNTVWQFAHDWLPGAVFFTSVFEEVSFLSLALVPHWQSSHLAAFESALFGVAPGLWLRAHFSGAFAELFAFGYAGFYPLYPIVGLTLWFWRNRLAYHLAFRRLTDALSVGYLFCYATYLLWPTQSPRHAGLLPPMDSAGLFHRLVQRIQHGAGVHGNAFPSAHIMLAFVVLVFVWRFFPRAAPWLLIVNILMCLGAVYDGYHWASDAVAGALLGTVIGLLFVRNLPPPAHLSV